MFVRAYIGSAILLSVSLVCISAKEPQEAQQAPTSATIGGVNITNLNEDRLQEHGIAPDYRLGPGDQIVIQVVDLKEIPSTPYRVEAEGYIRVPTIGRVYVEGLTAEAVSETLRERLKKILIDPDVTVSITEFRSQPVSILGAVVNPGIRQLEGHKTLFEMILLAGGLRPEAGNRINVTRDLKYGRIPLPDAADDPGGRFSVASVRVKSVMNASEPQRNIEIRPNDVIAVPRGELIYVIGAVGKPGGYVLNENESISALQIMSLAGGLDRLAAPKQSRILRPAPDSASRTEIAVDLRKILDGKAPDVELKPKDVLVIPTSGKKTATLRTIETAIGLGTAAATMAIYRY